MVRKRTITKPRGLPTVAAPVDLAADVVTPPPLHNGTARRRPQRKANATGARQTQQRAASPVDPDATQLARSGLAAARDADCSRSLTPPAEDARDAAAGGARGRPRPLHRRRRPRHPRRHAGCDRRRLRRRSGATRERSGVELPSVDVDPGPTPPPARRHVAEPVIATPSRPARRRHLAGARRSARRGAPTRPSTKRRRRRRRRRPPRSHRCSTIARRGSGRERAARARHEPPATAFPVEPLALRRAAGAPRRAVALTSPRGAARRAAARRGAGRRDQLAADQGAIPSRPMQEGDSERNLSPLAHTLAHIAEEAQRRSDAGSAPTSWRPKTSSSSSMRRWMRPPRLQRCGRWCRRSRSFRPLPMRPRRRSRRSWPSRRRRRCR